MIEILQTAVIIAFTGYLVAEALVNHDGPGDILEKIRRLAGVNVPDGEGGMEPNGSFTSKVFSCPYCMTPYALSAVTVGYYLLGIIDGGMGFAAYFVAWGAIWWMISVGD